MKIVCQSCSATYRIADEKVQGKKVFKIKCKKCGEDILVRGTDLPGEAPDEATRMMDAAGAEPIWHAVVNGDQQGPFTVDQVRELIAQGAVDGETYVWREGFDNWLPLHSVDELAGAFGPAPSIAPSAEMPAAGGDLFASMVPPPEEPERPSHVQPSAAAAAPVDNGLFAAMDAPRPAAQPAAAQPAAQPARAEPAKARAKTGGGDLFAAEAIQQESSRPLFSEEPAAASAGHDAGGESMTGQRNENSVLFSLASLQQLSTTRETKSAGEASGDASGLIDINKLAGAIGNAPANGSKKSSVDDILTVGASSGLGSPLAAPVLAPVAVPTAPVAAAPVEPARPAAGNKNMTAAIIGAAVIVMGGIVGAAYMVTSRNEPANTQGPVAAATPQPAATGAVPEAAPTPTAAPTPAPAAAPEAAPTPAAPAAGATPEPAAAPERDRERDRERRTERRERDRERPAAAPEPTPPPRPAAAAAPARPAAPARRPQGGSIEELMGQVTAGGNSRPSGNSGGGNSGGGNSGGGDVPEAPSRPAVASALRGVGPAVRACGTGTGGTATVTVVFNSSGGVNTANVQAPYAGTPVGSCIARAVRGAHIPPFSRPSFTVNYPFPLQ